jgi:3-isopropylmalate/(R)-2-methylmalate dehydratase small subunit
MEPFVKLRAVAAPLDAPNVDTDQIIPARFLGRPREEGLADALFHDLREKAGFVLNRPAFRAARILAAGANFGCGSSRENAVHALYDAGYRAVIAPSFGDIFFANCFKNGMLPIVLAEAEVAEIRRALDERPGAEMTIDLETQTVIGPGNRSFRFEVDPFAKDCLLQGLDEVAFTLRHDADIAAYEARQGGRLSRL